MIRMSSTLVWGYLKEDSAIKTQGVEYRRHSMLDIRLKRQGKWNSEIREER